jgi:hypothetical protein
MRTLAPLFLLLVLPACVAAIGNTGFGPHSWSCAPASMLQERVAAASRIVELRQRQLDDVRELQRAGRSGPDAAFAAEILLEEAKLRMIECRLDLAAAEAREPD